MERHHGVIGHEHNHGVRGVFLLTGQAHQIFKRRILVDGQTEGSEAALNQRVFQRFSDGLRDFIASVSVHFHHLTQTEQKREHNGEAA